jgi:L-threonylcarbamoyladenylate synthase
MTTTLKITEDDFDSGVDVALALLKSGGVLVYPTDTVYGIGGDATSEEVVKEVHRVKGSERSKPLSVMVSDFGMIDYYCDTGVWEDMILDKYLPGPYTFVLKKSEKRYMPASPSERLGVRIPDSAFCQALCQRFGRPIITTSANLTGQKPPVEFGQIDKKVLDQVKVAIDGGATKYKTPSIVIDLVERRYLREGAKSGVSLIDLPEP